MNTIATLYKKYPGKIPVAIDNRSVDIKHTPVKDLRLQSAEGIRARKPRSRESIVLDEFDTDLGAYIGTGNKTVYYMQDIDNPLPMYTTMITPEESEHTTIFRILQSALEQSLTQQGEMREKETRIFWVTNREHHSTPPSIHTTVVREKQQYRVVAEVGRNEFNRYTSLFSMGFPIEENADSK